MTRVAKLIKKHHWNDWTIKQIKDAMLWYALHGGYIHVKSKQGDSILLARRLESINQRLEHANYPGSILWVEFFYSSDSIATISLILTAIERFQGSITQIAGHDNRDDNPLTYKSRSPRFILQLLRYLWVVHQSNKPVLQIQPEQKLFLN